MMKQERFVLRKVKGGLVSLGLLSLFVLAGQVQADQKGEAVSGGDQLLVTEAPSEKESEKVGQGQLEGGVTQDAVFKETAVLKDTGAVSGQKVDAEQAGTADQVPKDDKVEDKVQTEKILPAKEISEKEVNELAKKAIDWDKERARLAKEEEESQKPKVVKRELDLASPKYLPQTREELKAWKEADPYKDLVEPSEEELTSSDEFTRERANLRHQLIATNQFRFTEKFINSRGVNYYDRQGLIKGLAKAKAVLDDPNASLEDVKNQRLLMESSRRGFTGQKIDDRELKALYDEAYKYVVYDQFIETFMKDEFKEVDPKAQAAYRKAVVKGKEILLNLGKIQGTWSERQWYPVQVVPYQEYADTIKAIKEARVKVFKFDEAGQVLPINMAEEIITEFPRHYTIPMRPYLIQRRLRDEKLHPEIPPILNPTAQQDARQHLSFMISKYERRRFTESYMNSQNWVVNYAFDKLLLEADQLVQKEDTDYEVLNWYLQKLPEYFARIPYIPTDYSKLRSYLEKAKAMKNPPEKWIEEAEEVLANKKGAPGPGEINPAGYNARSAEEVFVLEEDYELFIEPRQNP